ncbi:MAG: hypothetical protein ABH821_05200 [archaeon]
MVLSNKDKARKLRQETLVVHYPTLKTVLAVEEVIKNADLAISRNEILRRLERKAMRSTLNFTLEYMENRGMILETKKGFIWTYSPTKKDLNLNASIQEHEKQYFEAIEKRINEQDKKIVESGKDYYVYE